ncbi:MAG: hypothetical protein DWH81_01240 [Planctomycetota bacterium]|nr:MAG: hypothetical protein DWH81_01240 [Planctomycetota bacterium]
MKSEDGASAPYHWPCRGAPSRQNAGDPLPGRNSHWIDPQLTEPAQLLPLFDQYPGEEIAEYPVLPLFGSVRNYTPELIAPNE